MNLALCYRFLGVFLFGLLHLSEVTAWSGNVCRRTNVRYVRVRRCSKRFWGICWARQTRTICQYYTVSYCCRGWRHNGNEVCNIPICAGGCRNGGRCISPNKCRCPPQFSGDLCKTERCSELKPCYLGVCGDQSDTCQCIRHYTGNRCDTMDSDESNIPELTTAWAELSEFDREHMNMELYRFRADATDPDDKRLQEVWWNFDNYNVLSVSWEGHNKTQDLPPIPGDYMTRAEFGIVEAEVEILHKKLNFGTTTYRSAYRTVKKCEGLSSYNPKGFVNCTMSQEYDYRLENQDILEITVGVKSGGYRRFKRKVRSLNSYVQPYKGQWKRKTMSFRFDFKTPTHCVENNPPCSDKPLYIVDDREFRKDSFTISWEGWTDNLSGVYRYVVEIFKLELDRDRQLTEPQEPEQIEQTNNTDDVLATFMSFMPNEPGMYSIILEANDRANNSRYCRRFLLYDPDSTVEINQDNDSKIFISSAGEESGYQWHGLNGPITVTWKNHFGNKRHEDNGFLNVILPYPKHRKEGKNVSDSLDDHEGKRTLLAFNNTHGIVRCQYYSKLDGNGGTTCTPVPSVEENKWTDIPEIDVFKETFSFDFERFNGYYVCVWVRAFDVLGNNATDMTLVTIDETKPTLESPTFNRRNSSDKSPSPFPRCPYCSQASATTEDRESGVYMIKWRLRDKGTLEEVGSGKADNRYPGDNNKRRRRRKRSTCPSTTKCYCVPESSDNCFQRVNTFPINHCVVAVPKARLATLDLALEMDAVNGAGEWEITTLPFGTLAGLDELVYSPPYNFTAMDKSHFSATLHWSNKQNCYKRTRTVLWYRVAGNTGEFESVNVGDNETQISLNGLEHSTNYTIVIINEYGAEESDNAYFYVVTDDDPPLSGGEIVGIVIGLILLIVIAVMAVFMVILWRRGQLKSTMQRRFTQARSVIRNNVRRDRQTQRKTFIGGLDHSDDLYVYGNMSYDTKQNWEIQGCDLDLQDVITDGRFARIYKAILTQGSTGPKTVAAKMLKVTKLKAEEILVMKAKINFMASHALQHENVIQFIGAINDDEDRGPIMLLEYCEMGTLRDWLLKQKQEVKVTEELVDRLWHISLDVAKGMEYLTSHDIIHRKLAARNILLDFTLKPKIIGFGPIPDELEEAEADSAKGERLPMKWMAPELLKARSTRHATEKSDVWAYGVVVWEIFSLGEQPYPNIRSRDLTAKLKQGCRPKRPEFMPDEHDGITKRCWNQMPEDRPCFAALVKEQAMAFDNGGGRATSYYDSNELNNYYYSQNH